MNRDNESLRRHLAEKVMGWHEATREIVHTNYNVHWETNNCYVDKKGSLQAIVDNWNPPEDISQAFMCLETEDEWRIDHQRGFYEVIIAGKTKAGDGVDKSLPMAISLACARASGWEE